MTNVTTDPDGLTAVLLQLDTLNEKLTGLEDRHAASDEQLSQRITAVVLAVDEVKATLLAHAEALAAPAAHPADGTTTTTTSSGPAGYQPPPSPRFWNPGDPGLEEAADKLRAWVADVFRPGYGHHAEGLGECWEQHPLCCYLLDWLSELWAVLYLAPTRNASTLAGQAEWSTRLLPAASEQFARETRGCGHTTTRWAAAARPGGRS